MEYITENSESAKEKIGTTCFYCTYTGKIFKSEEELSKCYSPEVHRNPHGCCWGCDRSSYAFHKSHNLNGLHMKPISKDPIVMINFVELPDELKIKRDIIEDES